MSCGVGRRHGLDPVLLWCRPAAVAPIQRLAWELLYAVGDVLKKKKINKEKKRKKEKNRDAHICLFGMVPEVAYTDASVFTSQRCGVLFVILVIL